MRGFLTIAGALALVLLAGCASLAYLGQAAVGQVRLLAASRPVARVIADPSTAPELRERLQLVSAMRAFAATALGMGATAGFEDYAALGRDYAVWNVVASPEFSLEPLTWCFPVAGCVGYRGYFSEAAARRFATRLAARGYDTHVYGVAAYSTLGWFDDPVLDTWVMRGESALAALLFHELAHQLVYAPGDTAFSESYARVVEREGVRRWLARDAREEMFRDYLLARSVDAQFFGLLADARARLERLYRQPLDPPQLRERKAEVFARLRARYRERSREWPAELRFDAWMSEPLNNARLASVASYERWTTALSQLLQQSGGDLPAFHAAARTLARLPAAERRARLLALEGTANMNAGQDGTARED